MNEINYAEDLTRAHRTTVFIAAQSAALRSAAKLQLRAECNIIGEASNSLDVIREVLHSKPEVLLLDASLPDMDPLWAIRFIRERLQDCNILMMLDSANPVEVLNMITAGARGCCLRQNGLDLLNQAVPAVAGGALWLGPLVRASILDAYGQSLDVHKFSDLFPEVHAPFCLLPPVPEVHHAPILHAPPASRKDKFLWREVLTIAGFMLFITVGIVPFIVALLNAINNPGGQADSMQQAPVYSGGRAYRIIEMR